MIFDNIAQKLNCRLIFIANQLECHTKWPVFVLQQKKSFRICSFCFRQQKSQHIWLMTSVLCLAIEWSSKITLQAVSINQSGISFCCSGVIWHSCYAFAWLMSPEQTSAFERYERSGVSSSRLWSAPFFHSLMEDTRDPMRT